MAGGINKVILIGNLGQDPETRFMPSGKAVTNLRIATSERFKDRESGEQQERTEWHRITMYDRLAEISAEYLKKGAKVYVEGRLRTRKWQDKEGKDRYTTEIIADQMQMLDSRGGSGAGMGGGRASAADGDGDFGEKEASRASAPARSGKQPQQSDKAGAVADSQEFDDDIPF